MEINKLFSPTVLTGQGDGCHRRRQRPWKSHGTGTGTGRKRSCLWWHAIRKRLIARQKRSNPSGLTFLTVQADVTRQDEHCRGWFKKPIPSLEKSTSS